MSELNKITKEELTEVQDQQKQINELLSKIGVF